MLALSGALAGLTWSKLFLAILEMDLDLAGFKTVAEKIKDSFNFLNRKNSSIAKISKLFKLVQKEEFIISNEMDKDLNHSFGLLLELILNNNYIYCLP